MPDFAALALELEEAERGGPATALFTSRFEAFDWDDARAVARARDERRRVQGDRRVGYKLGWTSAPMREALGIDAPNWGTLWASQATEPTVDVSRFRHPKIEPELVFRATDATGIRGEWALGIEIVDPRFPSFDFHWLDNTADNSSCAGIVVGEFTALDAPATVRVSFTDGTVIHTGTGSAAMGSPADAVAWLVTQLAREGEALQPGDIVFTGGLTAPFDLITDMTVALTSDALPAVELRSPRRET